MLRHNRNRRNKKAIRRTQLERLEGRILLSDVQTAVVYKDIAYSQTSSAAPVLQSSDTNPYEAQADVVETSAGAVSSASIQEVSPAVGAVSNLSSPTATNSPLAFTIGGNGFASKSAMDSTNPDGTYDIIVNAVNDGTHTFALSTGSTDDYPTAAPQISNYDALQGANAANPITINWDAFPGGTANDAILVFVKEAGSSGQTSLYYSIPGQANRLTGTATSITIPAGTLQAAGNYRADITFIKGTDIDTTDYPGVTGYAGFGLETDISFTTQGTPVASKLVFTSQPNTYQAGGSGNNLFAQVSVEDSGGAVVTSDTSNISISLTNSAGAVLSGTLTQSAAAGVATFNDLSINAVGTYTLTATDSALTTAVSQSTTIVSAVTNGHLLVEGTTEADTINLTTDGNANLDLAFSNPDIANNNYQVQGTYVLASITSIDVEGNAGNDTITLASGVPGSSVQGGAGDDTIMGGPGNDTLGGGQGNDYILGAAGDDLIHGGAGDDSIGGGQGNDNLYGGLGNDTMTGGLGNDTLTGGAGTNLLRGGQGDDTFFAINGNADTLYGGAGNNTAHVDQNLDQIPNNDIQTILFS